MVHISKTTATVTTNGVQQKRNTQERQLSVCYTLFQPSSGICFTSELSCTPHIRTVMYTSHTPLCAPSSLCKPHIKTVVYTSHTPLCTPHVRTGMYTSHTPLCAPHRYVHLTSEQSCAPSSLCTPHIKTVMSTTHTPLPQALI